MLNLEGKRPHWKPRCSWEDCINLIVHVENMGWIEMVQPKLLFWTAVKETIKRHKTSNSLKDGGFFFGWLQERAVLHRTILSHILGQIYI